MSLENIIRPFQTGEISPAKPALTSVADAALRNTIINPGKNGSVKTFSGSFSLTITYYYIKKPKEKKQPPA